MRALTVKQPWAWAILHEGKDVENRTWAPSYRGPLLIHVSLNPDRRAYRNPKVYCGHFPAAHEALPGRIIGQVELVDVVSNSASPWAQPQCYHWILAKPRTLPPIKALGALGLWRPCPRVKWPTPYGCGGEWCEECEP